MCERCNDPNKTEVQDYTVHKKTLEGAPVTHKIRLCNDCARTYIDADIKLTGGKREAKPEASTEVSEKEADKAEKSVEIDNDEPVHRASRRRG